MLSVMCVAKAVIDYLLFLRISNWKIKNSLNIWQQNYLHWILLSAFSVCVYITFRLVFFSTSTITLHEFIKIVLKFDFKLLFLSLSKSYLGDSGLIRNAENPYALLIGQEKVLSYLVNDYIYLFLFVKCCLWFSNF
jgi:hypothetical protein